MNTATVDELRALRCVTAGTERWSDGVDAVCDAFSAGDTVAGYSGAGTLIRRWGQLCDDTRRDTFAASLPHDDTTDLTLTRWVAANLYNEQHASVPLGYDLDDHDGGRYQVGATILEPDAVEAYTDITHSIIETIIAGVDFDDTVDAAHRHIDRLAADGGPWSAHTDDIRAAIQHVAEQLSDMTSTVAFISVRRYSAHHDAAYARWAPHQLSGGPGPARTRAFAAVPAAILTPGFGLELGPAAERDTAATYTSAGDLLDICGGSPRDALELARHIDEHPDR